MSITDFLYQEDMERIQQWLLETPNTLTMPLLVALLYNMAGRINALEAELRSLKT